jgi:tellurite resistance protein
MPPLNQITSAAAGTAARTKWLARGAWLLAAAEGLVAVRNHLNDRLTDRDRKRLVEIVKSSKGLPTNLDDGERREIQRLIAKIEPKELVKTIAGSSIGARARRR